MTVEIPGRELATIEAEYRVVRPLSSPETALETWHQYEQLIAKLLNEDDYQTFNEGGKAGKFIKKSGYRKLATHYGFTVEMRDERLGHKHEAATCARIRFPEVFNREDKDCGCQVVFARYVVNVIAPNGRKTTGIGLCSTGERNRRFTRQDHDIATTAYTRAVNRAIGDMIGIGKPSAEEKEAEVQTQPGSENGALSSQQLGEYEYAWKAAPQERRDQSRALLEREGYAPGTFRARGREHFDPVLALLQGRDEIP